LPALPSAPSSPSVGDMYFDTTLGKIGVYTASGWVYYLYQIEDESVTTNKIADGAVTSSKLAPGAAVANLGYTPVNKAGDTMSGSLTVPSLLGPDNANLLINGRNYGVEIRIDEDSDGGDTFRITRGSGGSTTLMLVQDTGNVGIGTTSPTQRLDVAGNIRGTQFISTASTGTAPFQVSSTTKVTNLNADLLDGYDSTDFARKAENATITGNWTFNGDITIQQGRLITYNPLHRVLYPRWGFATNENNSSGKWQKIGTFTFSSNHRKFHIHAIIWGGRDENDPHSTQHLVVGLDSGNSTDIDTTNYILGLYLEHVPNSGTALYAIRDVRIVVPDPTNAPNVAELWIQWHVNWAVVSPEVHIIAPDGITVNIETNLTGDANTAPTSPPSTGTVLLPNHSRIADLANKLATARTISLGGSLSGSASFDGSSNITINAYINPASVGTTQIADGAVAASKLASGAVIGNLGYTPVNKAGDTMTGTLVLTHTTPLQVSSNTLITNLNADLVDGYHASDFPRKAENATITGSWTFNNNISAGNISATIGTLTVNNDTTIKGDLTIEGGANAIAIKESSSDNTPGYLEKVSGALRLTYTSNNPVMVHRGTATGQADLEIFKDAGSGDLPIYLRFHQSSRYWMSIKATRNLISFVNGDDTGFVDIQAKRVTANQDLVVAGNTIANSSGIPYAPLPALGNRNRDILVDRVAVWGDGMYPFALDLYKSDGWFTIPRYIFYGSWGQLLIGSDYARSNTTHVVRLYIVCANNMRNIYDPTDQWWNNGRTTGRPWVRLIKINGGTWESAIPNVDAWTFSPNIRVCILEIPTSVLDSYPQMALGIWWDANSPSWPTSNIPGDTIPNNYQNYGADIQWTIYQVWFEIYDRY